MFLLWLSRLLSTDLELFSDLPWVSEIDGHGHSLTKWKEFVILVVVLYYNQSKESGGLLIALCMDVPG